MAIDERIQLGDKIDIRYLQEVERTDEEEFMPRTYYSQVLDTRENGHLVIAMPVEAGKLVLLPVGVRYDLIFTTKAGRYRAEASVVQRYKKDNVFMLEVELKSELEKYQRREYYRYPCLSDMVYYELTEKEMEVGDADAIFMKLRENDDYLFRERGGCMLDLSGGGIRFASYEQIAIGSPLLIEIFLENESMSKHYFILGTVVGNDRNQNEGGYEFEIRVKFVIKDDSVRENIIRYIFEEERKTRQRH